MNARTLACLALVACATSAPPAATPVAAPAPVPPIAEPGDATDDLTAAHKAYTSGDLPGFLAASERAVRVQPGRPRAVYYAAAAYAVNGRAADSIAMLRRLAKLKVYFDLEAEKDFASVRAEAAYPALRADFEALKEQRTNASTVAFTIPEKDLLPEGIAYDSKTGAFFVASVHKRKIVRIGKDGPRDFTSEADGLWGVLGMEADPARSVLWACTSAMPEILGYAKEDTGKAALVAIDLASGRVKSKMPLAGPGEHNCNDLLVEADGSVLVGDAAAGDLLILAPGAKDLAPLLHGKLRSPQGIAKMGGALYVADYARGLARIDRASLAVRWLGAPDDLVVAGIDGLRAHGGELIAIQNGVDPHRVVALRVEGDSVRLSRVLEYNHPLFHEPTLGTIVGREMFYVADSQWGSFDKDGKMWGPEKLYEPTVLKLALE